MEFQERNVNQQVLKEYSANFARRLSDYFFIDHGFISGKEILKFCDINQVNLLILRNLFDKWQAENKRLRSPYFDYNNPEVQKALKNFMNVLSQHIHIQKDDFYHLLVEATEDTILLIAAPTDFYEKILDQTSGSISVQPFKELLRYVQFNKELLKHFVKRLELEGKESFSRTEAWEIFQETYRERFAYIEPTEWRLRSFADIVPLDIDALLESKTPAPEMRETISDEMPSEEGFAQTKIEIPSESFPSEPSNEAMSNSALNKTVIDESAFKQEEPATLNEAMQAKEQANLLHQFQKAKLENLRAGMNINQKFMFINHLFQGNTAVFDEAIDRIQASQNYEEARRLINQEYALRYHWDFDSEEVQEFFALVERKF